MKPIYFTSAATRSGWVTFNVRQADAAEAAARLDGIEPSASPSALTLGQVIHKRLCEGNPEAASPADQVEDARDAARYRWLREHGEEVQQWGGDVWFPYDSLIPQRLDNAIDAAISASKEQK